MRRLKGSVVRHIKFCPPMTLWVIQVGPTRPESCRHVRCTPIATELVRHSNLALRANRVLMRHSKQPPYSIRPSARASYCCGADLLVPCMKAWISSRVRRPSLFASIALKIRS